MPVRLLISDSPSTFERATQAYDPAEGQRVFSNAITFRPTTQLILLSGYPCSGKTYRAAQLKASFEARLASQASAARPMTVTLISDHALSIPRAAYATAAAEKMARATLSTAIIRALSPMCFVIVDAPSYIKGWRYQMYCEAKAQRTASCVVHVGTPIPQCRAVNDERQISVPDAVDTAAPDAAYDPPVFENLIQRYEEPNGFTRWDSPLFVVPYDDATPPYDGIWDALVDADGATRSVRPNAATMLPASRPADALSELERASQEVIKSIVAWLSDHPGEGGGEVVVTGTVAKVNLPVDGVGSAQLQRLRRQFVALYRSHLADLTPARMPTAFVEFLNDAWATNG